MPQAAKPRPKPRDAITKLIAELTARIHAVDEATTSLLERRQDPRAAAGLREAMEALHEILEDVSDVFAIDRARAEPGTPIPWEEAKTKLGLK
ncbi:MAG: hypothetical protein L0216_20105 [Planctomycetales bacterium]|nr:hypothetical protein [Planctomycetales bacterium]